MAESLVVRMATSISTNKATQARLERKPHGQQGSANELDTRHEISHQVGKRDFGLNERFVHSLRAAGDKQFVCPGDGEEQPERNAYQQDGILFQITATQQRKLDQPFPIHLLSLHRRMCCNDPPNHNSSTSPGNRCGSLALISVLDNEAANRKWRCRWRILAPRDYVSIRSTH